MNRNEYLFPLVVLFFLAGCTELQSAFKPIPVPDPELMNAGDGTYTLEKGESVIADNGVILLFDGTEVSPFYEEDSEETKDGLNEIANIVFYVPKNTDFERYILMFGKTGRGDFPGKQNSTISDFAPEDQNKLKLVINYFWEQNAEHFKSTFKKTIENLKDTDFLFVYSSWYNFDPYPEKRYNTNYMISNANKTNIYWLEMEVLGVDHENGTVKLKVESQSSVDPLFNEPGRDGLYDVSKGNRIKAENGVVVFFDSIQKRLINFEVDRRTAVPTCHLNSSGGIFVPEFKNPESTIEDNSIVPGETCEFAGQLVPSQQVKVEFIEHLPTCSQGDVFSCLEEYFGPYLGTNCPERPLEGSVCVSHDINLDHKIDSTDLSLAKELAGYCPDLSEECLEEKVASPCSEYKGLSELSAVKKEPVLSFSEENNFDVSSCAKWDWVPDGYIWTGDFHRLTENFPYSRAHIRLTSLTELVIPEDVEIFPDNQEIPDWLKE